MKKVAILVVAAMMMASCSGGRQDDPKQVAIDYASVIFKSDYKTMKRLSTEKNIAHVTRIENALKGHNKSKTKVLKVEATRVIDGSSDDNKYVYVTIELLDLLQQKEIWNYEMKIVKVDGKWYVDEYKNQ